MSNRVALQATQFIDLPGRERSLGYRARDDEAQTYDHSFESIQPNPLDFLRQVLETGDADFGDMIDFLRVNQTGMSINGDWHNWKQIEPVITNFYGAAAARGE